MHGYARQMSTFYSWLSLEMRRFAILLPHAVESVLLGLNQMAAEEICRRSCERFRYESG
jgi:hypothetical protein